jgi:hypothetical protein
LAEAALEAALGFVGRFGGGVARLDERGLGGAAGFLAAAAVSLDFAVELAGFRLGLAAGLLAAAVSAGLLAVLFRGARRAGGFGAVAAGVSSLSAMICSPCHIRYGR